MWRLPRVRTPRCSRKHANGWTLSDGEVPIWGDTNVVIIRQHFLCPGRCLSGPFLLGPLLAPEISQDASHPILPHGPRGPPTPVPFLPFR